MGTEVRGKMLGIIGLGNVGSEVARRARALEMRLIGHDPFISTEYAHNIQVELVPLKQLFKEADFITLHIPRTEQTKGVIGAKELATVKPAARIINTARGGLIDDDALAAAVREGRLAGAAVDVYPKEPCTESVLFGLKNIIVTPHLGASTAEAQVMAALGVAEQFVDVFNGRPARYAVNAPFIPEETMSVLSPFMAVATNIGRLLSQLVEGQMNDIKIDYNGEITNYDTNALKAAILGGLLEGISEERVNLVNANLVATQRGLAVVEQESPTCENYASLITATVGTSDKPIAVAGTVLRGEPHIVRLNEYWIDIEPTGGYFLFCDHLDRPGLIGAVGKITGDADINISYMHLSRLQQRGQALMVMALDEALSEAQIQQVLSLDDVYTANMVKL